MATSDLLTTIANNVPLVFEAGKKEASDEYYNAGIDDAVAAQEEFLADKPQTYYDILWDNLQNYGAETGRNYNYAFAHNLWTDENFNPKYPIISTAGTTTATMTFYNATNITDIKVPFICKASRLYQTFQTCTKLVKIPELNLHENVVFKDAFTQNNSLVELNVTGTIGQNGFDIHWSKNLNRASIESIINALSTTTSGLTVTLSATAVSNAFTDEEWTALETTKPNWTISLV